MRSLRVWVAVFVLAAVSGCATQRMLDDGLMLVETGRVEEGLALLDEASKGSGDRWPRNYEPRAQFLTRKAEIANRLNRAADNERAAGRLNEAELVYQRVLGFDPDNPRAAAGIDLVARAREHVRLLRDADALLRKGEVESAQLIVRRVLTDNPASVEGRALQREIDQRVLKQELAAPTLKSKLKKPVNLEFRDASLKQVFEALSRSAGINFVFDRDVRPDLKSTVFVKNVSVEDAIDLILLPNQLDKKVLSDNTVLVYPNTPVKQREYQDLIIKTFYLGNADPKQTLNLIKTMVKTKDAFIDEKVNMLVMRDTPDAIRLAEKLIAAQDLADSEVVMEVEVLEVNRNLALDLGVRWPDTFTTAPGATMSEFFKNLNDWTANSGLTLKALQISGVVNLLSNPRIRVKNREKARILVGDRLPVITATVTPGATNPVTTEQIQYLDVGLKVELEPLIHLDGDVAIKINLEVSNLSGDPITTRNGTIAYQVGTRTAVTTLRLKDNETGVLMGLIRDDDRRGYQGIPGLVDIPILGRLFGSHRNENQKTEIVFSITPRIVRSINRPEMVATEYWSGTEAALRTRPFMIQAVPDAQPPKAAQKPPTPAAGQGSAGAARAAAAPAADGAATDAPKDVNVAPPAARQPFELSLQAPQTAKVGEQFTVLVRGKGASPAVSAAVQFRYDKNSLEVVRIDEGDYLRKDGAQTEFVQRVDPIQSQIFISSTQAAGSTGVQGDGTLAVVTFKVLKPSDATQFALLGFNVVGANSVPMKVSAATPPAVQLTP